MIANAPPARIRQTASRGPRTQMRTIASVVLAFGILLIDGCANHYLIHPQQPAPQVIVWAADFARDQIKVHLEGARPAGDGPFPTVLVHPEEDRTAADMHGVIWDLAARGYVAIAADYHRWLGGKYRRNLFTWRSAADMTLIIDATRAYPQVDQNRIGALGFSEGAVISLLLAAYDPDRIKAVVAYYPITDFPRWYAGKRSNPSQWILFQLARWQLRVDADASDDDEFQKMLRQASPTYMAEYLRAPTLLIHGTEDTLAPPDESERLAESLKAGGTTTKLMLVPNAGRLFNFHQSEQAKVAWDASLDWLDQYLRTPTVSDTDH